jgi:FtsP/CotA-like multicopper oxidase with cupredoxin domain
MTHRKSMKRVVSALVTGLVAGGGLAVLVALFAPATVAQAATVACTAPGDLYAVSGSTTLGAQPVTVWGYSTTAGAVTRPGGPTLCVNAGDTVTVTLHNQLTENTALLFQGQQMVPDRTGAAPGATTTYTFTASRPGTYLYEAGLVANGEHQVSMGLYGALIVRPPAASQAYDATTSFDDEAVLVLSEVDPALNNAANPAAFDMRNYAPRYSLINGKAYPNTDPISASAAGNKVLLRYVNAGSLYHSLASLGAEQRVVALDGSLLRYSRHFVAETFGPGQTADAVVTTPAATASVNRLAIYDGSLLLHNSNAAGSGGMLTFVTVPAGAAGPDTTGPVASAVSYAAGILKATVDDTTTGGSNVASAEYFVDTVSGTGLTMTGSGPGSVNVTAAATIPPGEHIIYVRGQDSVGNRGVFSSVLVSGGDATGPTTMSPSLAPSLTNGSGSTGIAVHATGDDSATGGSNITAGEYFIDTVGLNGSGAAMTVNTAAPIASLDAAIPASSLSALTEGTHVVSVHSQDAAGNWGAPVTVNLAVDKTAPTTAGVSVSPTPNNGTLAFNGSPSAIRVTVATMSDPIAAAVNSTVSSAEAFIDTVGANGSGIVVRATDGLYNSTTEAGYFEIPLTTVVQLPDGVHTVLVHARDAAGNWGAMSSGVLLVDKVKPVVSAVAVSPSPTLAAVSVALSAQGTDAATAVTGAEWFRGTDPGAGSGTPMAVTGSGPWSVSASINVSSWSEGSYPVMVRVRDAAGNWSATASTVLQVRGPLSFSTLGASNPPGVVGSADAADIYSWNGSGYSRVVDASAAPYVLPSGANVDGFDRVDATHFFLSFTGQVNVPGVGNVQDEDVVYFNAGTWSLFFDGSVHGLTGAAATDLDAISIVGGQLFFSTDNAAVPPGAGGAGDDADIYLWNGGSSYTRVIDASAAPYSLPAAANVDGFVRIDASHFYLSFGTDTTVPGLGAVQDEDVIYYNMGVWSVYFDGTAHGLTSNNLDIDAFDVP